MQQALGRWEDSAWVNMGEGRVVDMLEETKVAVRRHGDEIECRGGQVNGHDHGVT